VKESHRRDLGSRHRRTSGLVGFRRFPLHGLRDGCGIRNEDEFWAEGRGQRALLKPAGDHRSKLTTKRYEPATGAQFRRSGMNSLSCVA
jgi:hypothetical protein